MNVPPAAHVAARHPDEQLLLRVASAALASIDLVRLTAQAFSGAPLPSAVFAVGKSAGAMLDGALKALPAGHTVPWTAVVPDGYPPPRTVGGTILAAPHPLPDERTAGIAVAARAAAALASPERPLWLCVSGGASAALGHSDIGPEELASATAALMAQGVDIRTLNNVRVHLCELLGGGLGARARGLRAAVAVDIATEDVALVGSGPALAFPVDTVAASSALTGAGLHHLVPHLRAPPPCPSWPHAVVAAPSMLREALACASQAEGVDVEVLEPALVDLEQYRARMLAPARRRVLRVAVGEIPVAIPRGAPPGGRAMHLCAWAAARLRQTGAPFAVLAMGSDGRDGPTEHAGAVLDHVRTPARGVAEALAAGASRSLLEACGALVPRFPSPLNLLDIHLCLQDVARPPGSG